MELFRVEECQYDYSPTLGIFDSLENAQAFLRDVIKATWVEPRPATKRYAATDGYWKTGKGDFTLYCIYKSTLNTPGEERLY
jgi:hypothetical protein